MNATIDITRVTYRWDDQLGVEAGWYVETWAVDDDGCKMAEDSQKIWFPVVVDDFGHDQEDELVAALLYAYPSAEIVGLDR
jgi:hypothetical protein